MKTLTLLALLFLSFTVNADVDFGETVSFYKLLSSPQNFDGKKLAVSGVVAAVEYHSGGGPLLKKIFLFPNSDSAAHFVIHEAIEISYVNDDLFNYVKKSLNMNMIEVIGDFSFNKSAQSVGTINNFISLSLLGKNRFGQDKIGDQSEANKQDKLW